MAATTTPPKSPVSSASAAAALDSSPSWLCRQILGRADVVPEEGSSTNVMSGVSGTGVGVWPNQRARSSSRASVPSRASACRLTTTARSDGKAARSESARSGPWSCWVCGGSTTIAGRTRSMSARTSALPLAEWTGSRTAPTAAVARCSVSKSMQLGSWTATTSPGSTPVTCRPQATASTSSRHCRQVSERAASVIAIASGSRPAAAKTAGRVRPWSKASGSAGGSMR